MHTVLIIATYFFNGHAKLENYVAPAATNLFRRVRNAEIETVEEGSAYSSGKHRHNQCYG